jgi:hypothetical protein
MSERTIQLEIDSISALFAYLQLTFLPWHLTTIFTEGYFISGQRHPPKQLIITEL